MTTEFEAQIRIPAARNVRVVPNRPRKKAEGAGNAGCTNAPTALRANKRNAREANTGTPKSHGTPCAMVLRLLRDLPGEPALLPPSPASDLAGLSPALAGQGPHAFHSA